MGLASVPVLNSLPDWENHLNKLDPSHIELGLERVETVRSELFASLRMPPVVLIAGTNGKGSSVALMQAALVASGFTVGAYTSPHLLQLNERITVDSKTIEDADFVAALNAVEQARGATALTYFEFITLAAAYYFAVQQVDIALLEVGLGGRLDAVNVFQPVVSLVTNVGLDHTSWLGDTREKIGREKAGIFRVGVPAIYADVEPVQSVIDVADGLSLSLALFDAEATLPATPKLQGVPQSVVWGALQALQALPENLRPSLKTCEQGFAAASLCGRFQQLSASPYTVIDVAHNAEATELLAQKLAGVETIKQWVAVFAAYADKDIEALLAPLQHLISSWVCCQLDGGRAASVNLLVKQVAEFSNEVVAANSAGAGWQQAAQVVSAKGADWGIIVFGSFETVAAVMRQVSTQVSEQGLGMTDDR